MNSDNLTTIYSHHTAQIQRIGATEGRKVLPHLERIEDAVVDILNKYRKRNITLELQLKIEAEIEEVTRKELQDYVSALKVENRALGDYESSFAISTLSSSLPESVVLVAPTAAEVNRRAVATPVKIGSGSFTSYTSLMKNYWSKYADEINGVVKNGFQNGTSIREVTNAILEELDLSKSGTTKSALDRARRGARQLAITGNNHYANTARIEFVNKNDNVLKGYRFLAVQDSRTSSPCRSLDQRVFKVDDPKLSTVTPPLHPNCRSALTYEVADKYKIDSGEKASSFEVDGKRDPKVIDSDGIYYANLSKLKASDQDAVLGSTLGKAMRKLDNPSQFAKLLLDNQNRPLTIKELTQQNNALGRILRKQNSPRGA